MSTPHLSVTIDVQLDPSQADAMRTALRAAYQAGIDEARNTKAPTAMPQHPHTDPDCVCRREGCPRGCADCTCTPDYRHEPGCESTARIFTEHCRRCIAIRTRNIARAANPVAFTVNNDGDLTAKPEHEPECPLARNCPLGGKHYACTCECCCPEVKAAYARGRQDAADAVEAMNYHVNRQDGCDCDTCVVINRNDAITVAGGRDV